MFFIVRGICEVFKKLYSSKPLYVTNIEPGEFFGEIAAVLNCPSSSTIKCKNYCTVATLQIDDYKMIAMKHPRLAKKMAKHIKADNQDPMTCFFMDRYQRIEYLKNLDKNIIEEFTFFLKIGIYPNNFPILLPGQICTNIYIIMKGVVEVYVNQGKEDVTLDYCGKGSVIG